MNDFTDIVSKVMEVRPDAPSLAANAGETGSFMFCESFLFETVTKCKMGAPVTVAIIPQIRPFVNL